MKGIDVSKHQGLIDWKQVAESGVEFAIIRAGYGKSTVDEYFIENIVGAHTAGLKVGVYWFIYALNEYDAFKNAELCHKTIEPYREAITMKVFADYEYDSDNYAKKNGVSHTNSTRTAIVKTFLKHLKENGWDVGNYANPDYIKSKFNDLSEYPLWLAYYTDDESKAKTHNPIMWQYSSKGSVPGIKGNVDMNICYAETKEEKSVVVNDNSKNVVHAYSKEKEGNTKLSANFKVKEFACNDGSDVVFVAPELVEILQKIRNHFGKAVIINSGYRTPAYNKKVGGATQSQHLYGTATDIRISGVNPKDIAKYVETLMPNTGGIGIYSNFVHVDVRRNKSRWNG